MKILTTTLGCDSGMSGIGRYTASLLAEWQHCEDDLHIYGHAEDKQAFFPTKSRASWHDVAKYWKSPLSSVLWHQLRLPALTKRGDVLFLPAGNRRLPLRINIPTVATVHDCSSLHVQGKYDKARDLYIKSVLPRLMQRLDHVITVSQSTRQDLIHFCGVHPEQISVIPLAADASMFFPREITCARDYLQTQYGICGPYLLYISRIEYPGKNHTRLIRAWEILKQRYKLPHKLVLVGPDKERAEKVRALAARSPHANEIIFTGPVPASALPLFYSAAALFVFPSLYEGFGLPVLESLSCGTPVACSNRSSLPEVGGDSVALFDPDEPESIAASVLQLLSESANERQERITAGIKRAAMFTWDRTAATTLQVLHRVGQRKPAAVPAPLPLSA